MILSGDDNIDHINIFSMSKSPLGRAMSNFSEHAVTITIGDRTLTFRCLEAYWHWLSVKDLIAPIEEENLINTKGNIAQKMGRALKEKYKWTKPDDDKQFRILIKHGIWQKCEQNPEIVHMLVNSNLPFCHYYDYGAKKTDAGYEWQTEIWEKARAYYKQKMGVTQ